jgi:hypothetical protein
LGIFLFAALPLAYFASLVPTGTPVAEGCSGAPSWGGAPPTLLFINLPSEVRPKQGEAVAVGKDGFFAFVIHTVGIEAGALLDTVKVEVRDEDDVPVPGGLEVLQSSDREDYLETLVAWHADEPLAVGQWLTAEASGAGPEGPLSATPTLEVMDAEPEVDFSAELGSFRLYRYDSGERVECSDLSECGPNQSFGTDFESGYAARVRVSSAPEVMVAWQYSLRAVAGKGVWSDRATTWRKFDETDPPSEQQITFAGGAGFDLLFRDELDEYCVEVTRRDLRSGETRSEEVCSSLPAEIESVERDSIGSCDEVPEEYFGRWCSVVGPEYIECEGRDTGSGGAPGTGDAGGAPATAAGGSSETEPAVGGSGGRDPEPATTEPPPRSDDASSAAGHDGAPAEPVTGEPVTRVVVTEGCGCRSAGRADGSIGSVWWVALGLGSVLGVRIRSRARARRRQLMREL